MLSESSCMRMLFLCMCYRKRGVFQNRTPRCRNRRWWRAAFYRNMCWSWRPCWTCKTCSLMACWITIDHMVAPCQLPDTRVHTRAHTYTHTHAQVHTCIQKLWVVSSEFAGCLTYSHLDVDSLITIQEKISHLCGQIFTVCQVHMYF